MADSQLQELEVTAPETTAEPKGGDVFNMDAAVKSIGESMFKARAEAPTETPEPVATETASEEGLAQEPVAEALPAPQTWPKDMHEFWGQTPAKVQQYWQTREQQMMDGLNQYKQAAQFGTELNKVVEPYQATLNALNIDVKRAVQELMGADHILRYSPPAIKAQKFAELAKVYGIDLSSVTSPESQPQIDPNVRALQEQLSQVQQTLTVQQQAAQQEAQLKVGKEVETFAADPAHPYFDEVADDIVPFVKAGLSLQDAYEKAVWANPVTRAKELAKQSTTALAKEKEKARLDALPKKQAVAGTVRSKDTGRSPTEPIGSMQDTMKATLAAIKARA